MSLERAETSHPLHPSQSEMAEALPQIVWTARPDGTVDWINQEFKRYTGISETDFAAGDWLLGVHPDDREPTLAVWEKATGIGLPYRTEFRVWCAAKERWRQHLVDARPHLDAAGQITRWYGITIDIQDLRDAEDAREAEFQLQIVERRVLEGVAAGYPLSDILKDICAAMGDVIKGTFATIGLVNEGRTHLEVHCSAVRLKEWSQVLQGIPLQEGHGSCGTAIFRRAPVFSDDIARDPLWTAYRDHAREFGFAACWSLPIFDASGQPIASFACYLSDPCTATMGQVSLLHRMAKTVRTAISEVGSRNQLQSSERRFRSLFDFLPIAIWEEDITDILTMLDTLKEAGVKDLGAWLDQHPGFTKDVLAAVRVLDANRAARKLYNVNDSDPDAPGQALRAMADDPKFRMAIREMLIAAWNGRTNLSTAYSVPRPDGTKADLLVRMLLPEPGSGRLLVTELDVTEQRRAEERFRHVAQASSDYIFDRDFASNMTWVNDAASWLEDHTPGACEVPRGAWIDSVHPDDSAELLSQIESAIAGGQSSWEGEYRLRQREGTYIPVLERASILRDDAGAPVRMIGNIINLSKQKELEAQLRQSQRLDAVGQLTGGIAHDFNNLLTVILGNAEALVYALQTDDTSASMARQIMVASEHAAELTQRLLAFARKQPLVPGAFDANRIVEDMQMLIERSMTPAISLDLVLASKLGTVHVDKAMFESALLNLCVNARDAMPEGGSLRIETSTVSIDVPDVTDPSQSGDFVRVSVSDTGEGMNEDTLARVFEPFFTTKPTGQGSGLGLSMVHGFVHQSGGHVHVRSSLGVGTTVELMLPRQAQSLDPSPDSEAGSGPLIATQRARILLVEDEDQVREHICMIATSLGYDVETETDAATALVRLRDGDRFDILLSDVVMPGGINGRQLAETVVGEMHDLPVLLISGHAEHIVTSGGQLDPRIGFMRKPFRKADLANRLADLLSG